MIQFLSRGLGDQATGCQHGTRPEMLSFADWNGLKVEEDLTSLEPLGWSHIWSWSDLKSYLGDGVVRGFVSPSTVPPRKPCAGTVGMERT